MVRFVGARPRLAAPYGLRLAGGVNPCTFFASGNGSLQAQDRSGPFSLTASGALRYAPSRPSRVNFVTNPSAETSTSGWFSQTNGALSRVSGNATQGSWAIQMVANGAGDMKVSSGYHNFPYGQPAVGASFTYSFDVYASGGAIGKTLNVQMNETGTAALDSVMAGGSQSFTLIAGWQRLSLTRTIANAYRAAIYVIHSLVGAANGDTLLFDGLQAEYGSVATAYLEGSAGDGARINLLKNPRFESSQSGWSAGNATITRVASDASFANLTCAEMVSSVSAGAAFSNGTNGGFVTKGQVYTASFDAYLVSGDGACKVFFYECDAQGGNAVFAGPANITITASVQRFSVTYTPSQTGVHRLQVALGKQNATATTVRFSNVVLEQGAVANPTYFDGGLGGVYLDPITGVLGSSGNITSVSQAAFWVEEGTTNIVPDPVFGNGGVITVNWAAANASGGASIARDTTFSYFGQGSGKVTCGASASDGILVNAGLAAAAASGQVWTASAYVRANSAADVGKPVRLVISERDSSFAALVDQLGPMVNLTDSWQRITFTTTLVNASTTKVLPKVYNASDAACTFNVDGVQLEQKAYATSLCTGSLGTGYSWSGSANASSSTRANTLVSTSELSHIDSLRGALVASFMTAQPLGFKRLMSAGSQAADHDQGSVYVSLTALNVIWVDGGSSQTTGAIATTPSVPHVAYMDWSGTAVSIGLDGGTRTQGTRSSPTGNIVGAGLFLGSLPTSQWINGLIGPVAIYSRPLTDAELAKVIALGPSLAFTSIQS